MCLEQERKAIYKSPQCCIENVHTKSINKRASDVRKEKLAKLYLIDHFFPAMQRRLEEFKDKYVSEKDVALSLVKDVVPTKTLEN